jgi:aminopeptidase N
MRSCIPAALAAALLLATPALAQEATTPPPAPRTSTAFTLASEQPLAPEQQAVRFDRAVLAFRIMPESRTLAGDAVLTFTATAPVDRLSVELDTVFDISAVELDGQAVAPEAWRNPEGRLTVDLPRTLAAGQGATLRLRYHGAPRVAPRAPWDGGFVWATAPSGEPWIATAVQGEGCDLFWPCIDHPAGEPGEVELHITVPSSLSAPSNGVLLGTEDHGDGWTTWRWRARQPNTYAIALNVGPYERVSATYESRFGNSFPMEFWHLRTDAPADVAALFAQFAPMLDFFEANVGPYPFADEKMGVVETPHLGMEHQTINAYGNQYRVDGRGYDWLLHHELAHEWFGNQMTNVDGDDMWLREGLGTYMQPLYARWLHGDRYMEAELKTQRESLANRFPVVSGRRGVSYFNGDGPGNDIYYKGSLFAHTLRHQIGDDAFRRALTRLVYGTDDPQPGQIRPLTRTTPDFAAIVRDITGRDYDWLFRGYLYNAALPVLHRSREAGVLALRWETGDGAPFPLPVEVEVDGRLVTVPMAGGVGRLEVPDGAHVLIDPDNRVLRQSDAVDALVAYRRRAR